MDSARFLCDDMAPVKRPPVTPPPDASDYIVFALRSLESKLDAAIQSLNERFDDSVKAAQQRASLYAQRDHEWTRQIENMGAELTGLRGIFGRLNTIDHDVRNLTNEIHDLHEEHSSIDARLRVVEACKARVEEHFADTAIDHATLSSAREWRKAGAWLIGSLIAILVSVGGIMPLIDRIWPHP